MEPEAGEEPDTFLRRAAQVAAFGAAVGAAVGAARAARRDTGEDGEPPQSTEPKDGQQEHPVQLQEQEEQEEQEHEEQEQRDVELPEEEERAEQQPVERAASEEEALDEEPEEPEERDSAAEQRQGSSDGRVTGEAAEVIGRALRQLEQLTGREPDGVLGVRRDDDGWIVTVAVVELQRVPSSTDVLASYDVLLDGDGELREYRRTGRYIRGRADPSEQ